MTALPPRQAQAREIIAQRIAEQGKPPLVTELAEAMGCNTTTAQAHLRRLVERGIIRRVPGARRSIEVVA